MIRVCLVGPESTGKTWCAEHLARTFRTSWSEEYARTHAAAVGRPLELPDVDVIARGQLRVIDAAIESASPALVIHDTDLLSTVVYSRHYYRFCEPWIAATAAARLADRYLLFNPDVPWEDDGIRDRGDHRHQLRDEFASALDEFGADWVEISGGWSERRERAESIVRSMLAF